MALHRQPLGDFLVLKGLLTREQLEHALDLQKASGKRLGQVLVDLGLLRPEQVAAALSEQLGVRFWDLEAAPPDPRAARLVPARLARRLRVVPVRREGGRLVLAMAEPSDVEAQDEVAMLTGMQVEPVLALERDIQLTIGRVFGVTDTMEEAVRQVRQAGRRHDAAPAAGAPAPTDGAADSRGFPAARPGSPIQDDHAGAAADGIVADDAPIVRLVDGILALAAREGATDVHFEPQEGRLRVRFRVDGLLRDAASLPEALQNPVAARIKVLADMDIADRRLPQDGRFTTTVDGRAWDVRVSSMPTFLGEKLVLRLLSKEGNIRTLGELGLDPATEEGLKRLLARPHGMILVTGPTGSGKSTTLAAALAFLNADHRNIVTVEDPIEHRLPGINQTQVNPRAGLTFGTALRHILRQDPDVIMVGEIRDGETADIAIKAALTGHLVLSTLHTNSAAGALVRLVDMGVEPYLVGSAVTGVIGQRLVRLLCPECREAYRPAPATLLQLGLPADAILYRPSGCRICRGDGFRGRSAVSELLVVDDAIRRLVEGRADADQIEEAAIRGGMVPMLQAGRARLTAGETSADELLRAVGGDQAEGVRGCPPMRTGHGAA